MRDIVATIQAEQDEIIRLDHPEVLVIEGGPGTGKTVVALHRVILCGFATHYSSLVEEVQNLAPPRSQAPSRRLSAGGRRD
jgi:hypothetical protein